MLNIKGVSIISVLFAIGVSAHSHKHFLEQSVEEEELLSASLHDGWTQEKFEYRI